jgi:hypothetical protein
MAVVHESTYPMIMNYIKHSILSMIIILLTGLLSACAGYGPTNSMIGSSKDHLVSVLGKPSTELQISDGQLLIYSKGPFGKQTFFVYLNRDGVVQRWTQVLDEKNFERIVPGMTRDQVIESIGEAKDRFGLARDRGYVWNYRYVNPFCFWFQIEFAADDTVRSTGYSKPPECRVRAIR